MDDDALLPASALRKPAAAALAADLFARAVPGALFETFGAAFRCTACAHRCVLAPGRAGACGVREATSDHVRVPFGYVARRYVRTVETNTVYHVEPGAKALTFGMYGCDLRCPYCHNWKLSQALREDVKTESPIPISPAELVSEAVSAGCRVICAAYNEPMIAAEWVRAIFAEARRRGLRTMVVSDGHTTREALTYLRPVTDVFRVDLKGFDAEQYRTLGARIEPVFAAIKAAKELGFWVEVVTLVVPSFNDDPAGLRSLARELVAIDPAMPWHLNAFQPRYRMRDRAPMAAELLLSVAGAAYARGMRFVYVGNVSSTFGELEHTRCPSCHAVLVERRNYVTTANRVVSGRCAACGTEVPGLWTSSATLDG